MQFNANLSQIAPKNTSFASLQNINANKFVDIINIIWTLDHTELQVLFIDITALPIFILCLFAILEK